LSLRPWCCISALTIRCAAFVVGEAFLMALMSASRLPPSLPAAVALRTSKTGAGTTDDDEEEEELDEEVGGEQGTSDSLWTSNAGSPASVLGNANTQGLNANDADDDEEEEEEESERALKVSKQGTNS
jgi:hypothetical protein